MPARQRQRYVPAIAKSLLPATATPHLHHRRSDATIRRIVLPDSDTAICMTVILH
jgi:hypothetical protein